MADKNDNSFIVRKPLTTGTITKPVTFADTEYRSKMIAEIRAKRKEGKTKIDPNASLREANDRIIKDYLEEQFQLEKERAG